MSPDHAVLVDGALIPDGVLIPARLLVNGASIVRETRLTKIRYFHVELDRHSILFSEGLPSESYLDTGNRSFFQNGGAVIDLNVGFVGHRPTVARETHCCRPFVYAAGSVLPIWTRLARRAEQLGYVAASVQTSRDAAPRITVDDQDIPPLTATDGLFSFVLPATATEVRLRSRAARPCDTRPWIEDHRILGMMVSGIRVRGGHGVEDLPLDGPALGQGWWDVEFDGITMTRWTNGDAVLRLPTPDGSSRILELTAGGDITYPLGVAELCFEVDVVARSA